MPTPLMRQIIFATDFSECAIEAQDYAVFLAQAYEAKLYIVHVPESPLWLGSNAATVVYLEEAQKDGERRLGELEKQLADSGLKGVEVRHVVGIPSEQINAVAREVAADLVVIGTHGRTGLGHIVLGSTAERVIKGAPCPVFTARSGRAPCREGEVVSSVHPSIQHILAPLDFSSPALDAAEYAIQMAHHFGAAMTLLHVLEPIYYDLDLGLGQIEQEWQKREHWRDQLSRLAELVRSFGLPAEAKIRGGVPAESIIACAKEQGCDLIVMGTHGRRGLFSLGYGSVAEAVLRQAPCPVLTVKSPKFEPGHRRVLPQTVSES
jgi:nucleotide-binding universal stress UspA family protein